MVAARGGDQRRPVLGVAHIAGERGDVGDPGEFGGDLVQGPGLASVDDEAPPPLGERTGQRESEAAGGAGDDGGRHAIEATPGPARPPSAIGPRTNLKGLSP